MTVLMTHDARRNILTWNRLGGVINSDGVERPKTPEAVLNRCRYTSGEKRSSWTSRSKRFPLGMK